MAAGRATFTVCLSPGHSAMIRLFQTPLGVANALSTAQNPAISSTAPYYMEKEDHQN